MIVDIDGLAVRIVDTGHSEPAVVLIHGLAGSVESWEPVMARLEESHRTIAIDLPGHGESDRSATFSYRPEDMAVLVDRVLAARGVTRAIWVGNSIGGQIALAAAVAGTPSVAAIVLINSTGVDEAAIAALLQRPDVIRARAGVAPDASLLDAAVALMFADPDGPAARRVLAARSATKDPAHVRAVMHTAVRARNAGLSSLLDRVEVPALVIWGEADRLLGDASIDRLAAIRGVSIVRLAGIGHMPQLEAPVQVEGAILEFAARVG
jgi:pimeloyl-ACP methyl ester carboxylesterase